MAPLANQPGTSVALSRSVDAVLDAAQIDGMLRLNGRNLRQLPPAADGKYDLTDAVYADISHNRFSCLPDVLCTLHRVEHLYLAHNRLRSLPPQVSNWGCLAVLDLTCNQLLDLPVELFSLPLEILLLGHNQLTAISPAIRRLRSSLQELDLEYNFVSTVPSELSELSSLRVLNARGNKLTSLPSELCRLRLHTLDVSDNELNELPTHLRSMGLKVLNVAGNPLPPVVAKAAPLGPLHLVKASETIESSKRQRGGGARHQQSLNSAHGPILAGSDWTERSMTLAARSGKGNRLAREEGRMMCGVNSHQNTPPLHGPHQTSVDPHHQNEYQCQSQGGVQHRRNQKGRFNTIGGESGYGSMVGEGNESNVGNRGSKVLSSTGDQHPPTCQPLTSPAHSDPVSGTSSSGLGSAHSPTNADAVGHQHAPLAASTSFSGSGTAPSSGYCDSSGGHNLPAKSARRPTSGAAAAAASPLGQSFAQEVMDACSRKCDDGQSMSPARSVNGDNGAARSYRTSSEGSPTPKATPVKWDEHNSGKLPAGGLNFEYTSDSGANRRTVQPARSIQAGTHEPRGLNNGATSSARDYSLSAIGHSTSPNSDFKLMHSNSCGSAATLVANGNCGTLPRSNRPAALNIAPGYDTFTSGCAVQLCRGDSTPAGSPLQQQQWPAAQRSVACVLNGHSVAGDACVTVAHRPTAAVAPKLAVRTETSFADAVPVSRSKVLTPVLESPMTQMGDINGNSDSMPAVGTATADVNCNGPLAQAQLQRSLEKQKQASPLRQPKPISHSTSTTTIKSKPTGRAVPMVQVSAAAATTSKGAAAPPENCNSDVGSNSSLASSGVTSGSIIGAGGKKTAPVKRPLSRVNSHDNNSAAATKHPPVSGRQPSGAAAAGKRPVPVNIDGKVNVSGAGSRLAQRQSNLSRQPKSLDSGITTAGNGNVRTRPTLSRAANSHSNSVSVSSSNSSLNKISGKGTVRIPSSRPPSAASHSSKCSDRPANRNGATASGTPHDAIKRVILSKLPHLSAREAFETSSPSDGKRNVPSDVQLMENLHDGVILCEFLNQLRPRAVPSIHRQIDENTPLSPAKAKRNIENFLLACRRFGLAESLVRAASDHLPPQQQQLQPRGTNAAPAAVARLLLALNRLDKCGTAGVVGAAAAKGGVSGDRVAGGKKVSDV